jgi:hypothetical protein
MSPNSLADLFPHPSDATRNRRRDDLLQRGQLVRANGWAPYQAVWSTGEVVGVAALLNDLDTLSAMDETLHSAWSRWAFDLWGMTDGQADVDNGCRETRRWFIAAAQQLSAAESSRD